MDKILRWIDYDRVIALIREGWSDFVNTEFDLISYLDVQLAINFSGIIILLIFLKLLFIWFGRKKYARADSGHLIYQEESQGFISKIFLELPKIGLAIPAAAVLFAIANPTLTQYAEEKKFVETRTMVFIKDVSGSMSTTLPKLNGPKGKAAMEFQLKLLKARQGQGDRISFWLFSNKPYQVHDFTTDEKLAYFLAFDAPWEVGNFAITFEPCAAPPPEDGSDGFGASQPFCWDNYPTPRTRYRSMSGEGGTVPSAALRAVGKQLEDDEIKNKKSGNYKRGSVIMITDAEISELQSTIVEIQNLGKKGIKIYLIWINIKSEDRATKMFFDEILRWGGRYFPISDPSSISRAYDQINKFEKTRVEVKKISFSTPLFYKFIFLSVLSLIIIIPFGLMFQLLRYP